MVIMHFIQVSMILILFINPLEGKLCKYKKETWTPPMMATQETTTYMFS